MNFAQTGNTRCARRARRSMRGGVVLGIFIGLILGLAIAAAVAFYLGRGGTLVAVAGPRRGQGRGARQQDRHAGDRAARRTSRASISTRSCRAPKSRRAAPSARPRDKAIERPGDKAAPDTVAKAAPPAGAAKPADRFWLQAGSFASRIRRREPEGAARARRLGSRRPVGDVAGQGRALSRAPRSVRQHRRSSIASRASSARAASTSRSSRIN